MYSGYRSFFILNFNCPMVIERYNTTALLQEVVTRLSLRTGDKHAISTDSTRGELPFEVLLECIQILLVKSNQSVKILFRVSGFIISEEKKFAETCRDHVAKILANISGAKPSDLSILFTFQSLNSR